MLRLEFHIGRNRRSHGRGSFRGKILTIVALVAAATFRNTISRKSTGKVVIDSTWRRRSKIGDLHASYVEYARVPLLKSAAAVFSA